MKFLIHSNAPTIGTGYGVQTRQLASRLAADGHEVAVSCTYGHQGGIGTWQSPNGDNVRLYPSGYETNSPDVIVGHAEHWFDGDPKGGWIILLLDVWCFNRPVLKETLSDFQVIAWTPVDHFPAPPQVLSFLQGSGSIPVAMSDFGERQLVRAGLDATCVPLSVDTSAYKPTFEYTVSPGQTVDARTIFELPRDAFVVGMVAMNKDGQNDRKGFDEAFQGFARFWRKHQDAVLFVHTDQHGLAGGADLARMAAYSGIPQHALVFSNQYGYRLGLPPEMMAAAYTAMDVLLAPSRGEGFCVPMIEAQACGTPVIASDFTAQTELIGPGWLVDGQLKFDVAQSAYYQTANVNTILDRLEEAYEALDGDLGDRQHRAMQFAAQYDADVVYETRWRPFIESLQPVEPEVKPKMERVDVIVPAMRHRNVDRFNKSLKATAPFPIGPLVGESGVPARSYAENVNRTLPASDADWVLIVGDDVEFTPGWFEAAQEISDRYDVIGTNDSEPGRVRNAAVASGQHADHFFIRRSYIDELGSSLDGPGVIVSPDYHHWYCDKEIIELAKARGVYGFARDCRIIHHHPGYDGDEEARSSDPTYMKAVEHAGADAETWEARKPLIEGHRVTRVRS